MEVSKTSLKYITLNESEIVLKRSMPRHAVAELRDLNGSIAPGERAKGVQLRLLI